MIHLPVGSSAKRPTTILLAVLIVLVAVNLGAQVRVAASPDDCLALGGALVTGECQISVPQTKSGTFTLDETLHILGTGSITVPAISGGNALTLNIKGDLIIDVGGQLIGDVSTAGGVGATISINAHGDIVLHGAGTSGARLSSSQSAGSCTGGKGGNINLDADGKIVVEPGSIIAANSNRCRAGDILMTADGTISIDGLVSSGPNTTVNPLPGRLTGQVLGGGGTTQAGGKITIVCNSLSSPSLTVSKEGILVSQGEDPGADTVLIEGCDVEVNGLVASVGKERKAEVVLRSGGDISINGQDLGQTDINSFPNQGRVRADNTLGGADQSKVDIFARGSIDIHGPPSGTIFVVTSNPGTANSRPPGGFITLISLEDRITATGKAFQAGRSTAGNSGGTIDLKARLDIGLDGAIMAVGDFVATGGYGTGGEINVRSFSGAVSWVNGIGDVQPTGTGIADAKRGVITLTACTTIDTTGTSFPVTSGSATTPTISTGACSPSAPTLPQGVADLPNCQSIVIVKDAVPDDPQDFPFAGSGSIGAFSLDDDGDPTLPNTTSFILTSGNYTVSETVPPGWGLSALVCVDPDGGSLTGGSTATIDLDLGETVTCTFTDAKLGTIIVEKQTDPDGATGSFDFTGAASGSISDGGQITVPDLLPGAYTSTETVPEGWELTSISCDDGNSATPSTFNLDTRTATFNLDPGESVKCTFTNMKKLGTIEGDKFEDADGDGEPWETGETKLQGWTINLYDTSGVLVDTKVTDENGHYKFDGLASGTYTVCEVSQSGYAQTYPTSGTSGSEQCSVEGTRGWSVTLTTGSSITGVDFGNVRAGIIIVEKQTVPDGAAGNFTFTGDAVGTIGDNGQIKVENLAPGTYTSTEDDPSSAFDLVDITCEDSVEGGTASSGSVGTRTATFNLDPGETVKCVFTNTKSGTIIVEKRTVGGDDIFSFTGSGTPSGDGLDESFTIETTGGSGSETFTGIVTSNTYTITEGAVPLGWEFVSTGCVDQDNNQVGASSDTGVSGITVSPGGTVTCTFMNMNPAGLSGAIKVDKVTDPASDPQSFGFLLTGGPDTPPVSQSFSLTDTADPYDSGFLAPGDYSVTENVPFGWDLTGITCSVTGDHGSSSSIDSSNKAKVNIKLKAGDIVTCTFTDTKRPQCLELMATSIFGEEISGVRINLDGGCYYTSICLPLKGKHKVTVRSTMRINGVQYTFVGWATDSTPPLDMISTSTSITFNAQPGGAFYPVYKPAQYKLTVYVKVGGKPITGATVQVNVPSTSQSFTMTTDKYGKVTFSGIYGGETLTLKVIINGQERHEGSMTLNGNTTVKVNL